MTPISEKANLEGKRVLVTGALGSIGKAVIESFLGENATVIASDLKETNKLSLNLKGEKVHFVDCNIADEADVQHLMNTLMDKFNGIDIVVHCAGIYETTHEDDLTLDAWKRMLDINLTGTFLVTNSALKIMKQQQSGKIINLASNAGQTGGDLAGLHYAASKGGVIAYTKRLAKAAAPYNVHVNAIAPGPIESGMIEGVGVDTNNFPLGRIGAPEDIAETAIFLGSQASEFITGQVIGVNGGLVI